MYHLVQNFKKKYSGQIFYDHLWASAYSGNPYMFEKHYQMMAEKNRGYEVSPGKSQETLD
jgi:hypothetical protein